MGECGKSPHSPWGSWGRMLCFPHLTLPVVFHLDSLSIIITHTCIHTHPHHPHRKHPLDPAKPARKKPVESVDTPDRIPYLDGARIFAAPCPKPSPLFHP